VKTAANLDAQL